MKKLKLPPIEMIFGCYRFQYDTADLKRLKINPKNPLKLWFKRDKKWTKCSFLPWFLLPKLPIIRQTIIEEMYELELL